MSWALADVDVPTELWRAELAWWRTVESEAEAMMRSRLEGERWWSERLPCSASTRCASQRRWLSPPNTGARFRARFSMTSADLVRAGRMSRVAVVAPRTRARDVLVELARAGCVELAGNLPPAEGEEAEALRRLRSLVTESREPTCATALSSRGSGARAAPRRSGCLPARPSSSGATGSRSSTAASPPGSAGLRRRGSKSSSERLAESARDSSSSRARPGSIRPRSSGRPQSSGLFVRLFGPTALPATGMSTRPCSRRPPSS